MAGFFVLIRRAWTVFAYATTVVWGFVNSWVTDTLTDIVGWYTSCFFFIFFFLFKCEIWYHLNAIKLVNICIAEMIIGHNWLYDQEKLNH